MSNTVKPRDIIYHKQIPNNFLEFLSETIQVEILGFQKKIEVVLKKDSSKNKGELENLGVQKSLKENTLNEIKSLEPLLKVINENASKIYSDTLKRMPSLFLNDRDIAKYFEKDISDLNIYLDCDGDGICFDHHGTSFMEDGIDTDVATTEVLKFVSGYKGKTNLNITILSELLELGGSFQKKDELLDVYGVNELQNNQFEIFRNTLNKFIPKSKGYLDSDAILSHFVLLFPRTAKKHKKLIDDASVFGDLNLEVGEKSKNLNNIIMGLVYFSEILKKYYKSYIQNSFDENMSKKEKKMQMRIKLAIFDTVLGNALVKMVPSMIKFVNNEKINIDLAILISCSLNNISNIFYNKKDLINGMFSNYNEFKSSKKKLDENEKKLLELKNYNSDEKEKSRSNRKKEKTEVNLEIKKEQDNIRKLFKLGLLKIKIKGSVIYFFSNKRTSINLDGIPPESFYKYIRTLEGINVTNLKYCVISIQGGNGDDLFDFKEDKTKSKGIFISNIPHSRDDLEKYSLRSKIFYLNNLELQSLVREVHISVESKIKILKKGNQNGKTKAEINMLTQKLKTIQKRIEKHDANGPYHARNGFIFISSGYSPLEGIVDILNNDNIK